MTKLQALHRAVLEREEAKEVVKARDGVAICFFLLVGVHIYGCISCVLLGFRWGCTYMYGDDTQASHTIDSPFHVPEPTTNQVYAVLLGSLREYEAQRTEEWGRDVEAIAQVCLPVCLSVCLSGCLYVCMCVWAVNMCVYICVCVYIERPTTTTHRPNTHIHAHTHTKPQHAPTHTHTYTHV